MTVRVGEYDGSPGSLAAHAAAPGLDEVRLLYETSRRISTAMDIPGVVEAYLQQVAAGGHYSCHVSLYEKDQEGQRSGVLILGRWTPEDGLEPLELRYPFLPGELDPYAAIMPTLDAGQAVTITDVHTDPRASATLRAVQARVGKPALAMFPLMVRDQHIGLVIMSCSYPHQWEDAELHPYRATAALLAMAIDSRQQY